MAIEIRELVVRVRVEESNQNKKNDIDVNKLKSDLMREFKREIKREIERRKER